MPFICQVRPTEDFQEGSFYQEEDKADNEKAIIVEYGKLKDSETSDIHRVLYEPDEWQWEDAEKHCASLDGALSEPKDDNEKERNMTTSRRLAIYDTIDPIILLDLVETVDDHDEYEVRINTYGGDLFAAIAFMSLLKDKNVTAYVDGICASAGTVISSKANKALMNKDGFLFIHNPFSFMVGDYRTMEEEARALKQAAANLANMYAKKSKATGKNVTVETFRHMMDSEEWLSGEQALAYGLVDDLFDKPIENRMELVNRVMNLVKKKPEQQGDDTEHTYSTKGKTDTEKTQSDYIEKKLKTMGIL